uniref:Uncharacterized protein n=1 Tax=Gorilla gorilla gorilla TaxID=9595 RepID=A0A2I2YHP5_GORGO
MPALKQTASQVTQTLRDLQRLGELQSELAGVADFSATYLRCQLLLIKALQEKLWNVAAPLYLKQSDLASAAATQIMEETYKMEFMLQAKALQLIITILQIKMKFRKDYIDLPPRLNLSKVGVMFITDVIIHFVKCSSHFCLFLISVLYPDGQAQMIHPKPADFRNPGPGRHRLITQVYLSHTAWTEACQVEVRLLLAYNSSARIPKCPWMEGGEMSPQVETSIEGTIPFSKPVKVYIMPKPARR